MCIRDRASAVCHSCPAAALGGRTPSWTLAGDGSAHCASALTPQVLRSASALLHQSTLGSEIPRVGAAQGTPPRTL
eukprot:8386066-Pyramimonas_sp.AAC.1